MNDTESKFYKTKHWLVFGKVLISLGDALGKHLRGGFKKGDEVSRQKCRHCYWNFNGLQPLLGTTYL